MSRVGAARAGQTAASLLKGIPDKSVDGKFASLMQKRDRLGKESLRSSWAAYLADASPPLWRSCSRVSRELSWLLRASQTRQALQSRDSVAPGKADDSCGEARGQPITLEEADLDSFLFTLVDLGNSGFAPAFPVQRETFAQDYEVLRKEEGAIASDLDRDLAVVSDWEREARLSGLTQLASFPATMVPASCALSSAQYAAYTDALGSLQQRAKALLDLIASSLPDARFSQHLLSHFRWASAGSRPAAGGASSQGSQASEALSKRQLPLLDHPQAGGRESAPPADGPVRRSEEAGLRLPGVSRGSRDSRTPSGRRTTPSTSSQTSRVATPTAAKVLARPPVVDSGRTKAGVLAGAPAGALARVAGPQVLLALEKLLLAESLAKHAPGGSKAQLSQAERILCGVFAAGGSTINALPAVSRMVVDLRRFDANAEKSVKGLFSQLMRVGEVVQGFEGSTEETREYLQISTGISDALCESGEESAGGGGEHISCPRRSRDGEREPPEPSVPSSRASHATSVAESQDDAAIRRAVNAARQRERQASQARLLALEAARARDAQEAEQRSNDRLRAIIVVLREAVDEMEAYARGEGSRSAAEDARSRKAYFDSRAEAIRPQVVPSQEHLTQSTQATRNSQEALRAQQELMSQIRGSRMLQSGASGHGDAYAPSNRYGMVDDPLRNSPAFLAANKLADLGLLHTRAAAEMLGQLREADMAARFHSYALRDDLRSIFR